MVALAVLALITVLVTVLVLRGTGGLLPGKHATEDTNSSTPSVSAWDETSKPPLTMPPRTDFGGDLVICPIASGAHSTHQVSGKLTADTLQVSKVPGWDDYPTQLQIAYDIHAQVNDVYPGWMANTFVGLLSNADGFTDLATSAEITLQCFVSQTFIPYITVTGRVNLIAGEQISVSGHAAWHTKSEVLCRGAKVKGDVVDVVIVDLGAGKDHLGLFLSTYPIDDSPRQAMVEAAIESLTVIG